MSDGLCACGCGKPTRISRVNHASRGWVKGQPIKYLNGHNHRGQCGARSTTWKGGRSMKADGYVLVSVPGHPRADTRGYVREHILIAEKALGHSLPPAALVHHVDEDRANNANDNLVVCENHQYHMLLHRRQRAFDACGDATALLCPFCGVYGAPAEMYVYPNEHGGLHRACATAYRRKKRGR